MTQLTRRLFVIADVFFSFFQLFKGLSVALVRLLLVVAVFGALSAAVGGLACVEMPCLTRRCVHPPAGLTFARSDMSQLPAEHEHYDMATAAYNAVLMMDLVHNHPLKWAFERSLVQRVNALRTLRKVMRQGRSDAPHAATGDATHQSEPPAHASRVELELGSVAGKRVDSWRETSPPASRRDGSGSSALLPPKRHGSMVQSHALHCRLSPRQQRIRNRWHMAVTLSRMPWLAAMRQRTATHELVKVWPRASLDGECISQCTATPERQSEMRAFVPGLYRAARAAGDGSLRGSACVDAAPIERTDPAFIPAAVRRRAFGARAQLMRLRLQRRRRLDRREREHGPDEGNA